VASLLREQHTPGVAAWNMECSCRKIEEMRRSVRRRFLVERHAGMNAWKWVKTIVHGSCQVLGTSVSRKLLAPPLDRRVLCSQCQSVVCRKNKSRVRVTNLKMIDALKAGGLRKMREVYCCTVSRL